MSDAIPADVNIAYLKGPMQVRPRRDDVATTCLGLDSAGKLVPAGVRYLRLVRNFRPDIVHAHMFHAVLLARLLHPVVSGPRLISTMHTSYDGGCVRAMSLRATEWLSDLSTNVSREAIDTYAQHGAVAADRMIPIYNGIDVARFRPVDKARERIRAEFAIPDDRRLLLAVGRLNWSKDYPNLFQALTRLDPALDYQMLIAGDGPHRKDLTQLVEMLGLSSRVRFLGLRNDVPTLMSAADVFVLSSLSESFGLVVGEAMACECIVVATNSGGIREVMGDDDRFLVPVSDPDALAAAIQTACALDPEHAAVHKHAARRRIVECFSFERMIRAWMDLYQRLLHSPSSADFASGRLH